MIATERMPSWVRLAEVVLGLISLFAGIYVLAYPGIAVLTLVILLAVGLVFLGWRDIVLGAMSSFLPGWLRLANIVLGLAAFVLSATVISSPGFAIPTLILILYVALFVRGVSGITMGAAGRHFSRELRGLSIGVGALGIALAIVFLALPLLAVATLVILLSIGLLVTGIESIGVGVTGRKIVPVVSSQVRI